MENEVEGDLGGEGLQVLGGGELRNQGVRVGHVDLLLEQARAEVEIQAPLEVLSNQIFV